MPKAKGDLDKEKVGSLSKEQEPGNSEESILGQIIEAQDSHDKKELGKVEAEISGARRSHPEPTIPPDVLDAGVKSPQTDADEVISKGPTISLPISEEVYNRGLHQKVKIAVKQGIVSGFSSIAGLVMWVGRVIKVAHGHAKKVIFKNAN